MADYDVYELNTAAELDAAFAKTFHLHSVYWAENNNVALIRHFIERQAGKRRMSDWAIHWRGWGSGTYPYEALVGNAGESLVTLNVAPSDVCAGYGRTETEALMKAAIEWDQRRRAKRREADGQKRATLASQEAQHGD